MQLRPAVADACERRSSFRKGVSHFGQVFALLSRAAHHGSAAERLCALQHHMVHEVRQLQLEQLGFVYVHKFLGLQDATLCCSTTWCTRCTFMSAQTFQQCISLRSSTHEGLLLPIGQVDAATHHVSDPIAAASLARGIASGGGSSNIMAGGSTTASGGSGTLLRGGGRTLRLLWH